MIDTHADRLLNVRQLADLLSLSERSVRRLLPEIGYVRLRRTVRIPQSNIENYLQSRSVPPLERSPRRRAPAQGNMSSVVDRIIPAHRHRSHVRTPVDMAIRALQPVDKVKRETR